MHPQSITPARVCEHCGAARTTRQQRRFCSRRCANLSRPPRPQPKHTPLVERFWARVRKDGPTPPHRPDLGPCWVWVGVPDRAGYGHIASDSPEYRRLKAHRVSWELHYGPVPDGLWVLHHCDNPPCVNPAHLWLGTNLDNVRDMVAKGRHFSPWGAGAAHYKAKLTEQQVRDIRARYAAGGITTRALAALYGMAGCTIHQIVSGRTWRHIA